MNWSLVAKRLRIPLGFILAGTYLILVRPTPRSLMIGMPIALIGVLIRAWASGHIMKNDRLATSGPYSFTRNPLYVGSFLIAVGFALVAHWLLLAGVVAFFVLIYAPTIARERANIENRFPVAYEQYAANVPAFLPRLTPWRNDALGTSTSFSPSLYVKHGEWKAALAFVLVALWLFVRLRGVGA
ncbi:MAG TPA: isoprenylcysteine carboxylmethyltransferase family protein [Gemmatimonadaceae bacterium]|nr:isoprenylcysteine carboxylmethyltransferase family protein [Gemmatimonadaceae bacterium]